MQEAEDGMFTSQQCEPEVETPYEVEIQPDELRDILPCAQGPSSRSDPKRRATVEDCMEIDRAAPSTLVVTPNRTVTGRLRKSPVEQTTRHRRYEDISSQAQRKRHELIKEINKNWDYPRRFWPERLNPRVEVAAGVSRPLDPQDISTSLLAATTALSNLTKNNMQLAYKVMKRAVATRNKKSKGPGKLLPKDVEQACKLIKSRAGHPSNLITPESSVTMRQPAVRLNQLFVTPGPDDMVRQQTEPAQADVTTIEASLSPSGSHQGQKRRQQIRSDTEDVPTVHASVSPGVDIESSTAPMASSSRSSVGPDVDTPIKKEAYNISSMRPASSRTVSSAAVHVRLTADQMNEETRIRRLLLKKTRADAEKMKADAEYEEAMMDQEDKIRRLDGYDPEYPVAID